MNAIGHFGSWLPSKRPRSLGPHRDPGLELVYVAKGEVAWDYEGQAVAVRPPAISFTLPWQMHSSATPRVPSCELHWILIKLDQTYQEAPATFSLHPDLGLPAADEARVVAALRQAPSPVVAADNLLASLMPLIVSELDAAGDSSRIRCLVNLILIELMQAINRQPMETPSPSARQRVRNFMNDLRDDCSQPWALEDMAAACDLGRSQFAEHLEALTGDSPVQLLNRLRVEKACHLLRTTDQDVTTIAFACGFNTSQYFARVFREYTNASASAWRRLSGA